MLKISKNKQTKYLYGDKLVHYPYHLKLGNQKINLNEKWFDLKMTTPPRQLEIEDRVIPSSIGKNFYYYLTLPNILQDRCLRFCKFTINSNFYERKLINKNFLHLIPFGKIIKFFQKTNSNQNQSPYFVHAAVSLGNGLCISKLGKLGIYIQDINDIVTYYEVDDSYIKVCSPKSISNYKDDNKFYENLHIANTFDENEL